jgi:hypothetical protein
VTSRSALSSGQHSLSLDISHIGNLAKSRGVSEPKAAALVPTALRTCRARQSWPTTPAVRRLLTVGSTNLCDEQAVMDAQSERRISHLQPCRLRAGQELQAYQGVFGSLPLIMSSDQCTTLIGRVRRPARFERPLRFSTSMLLGRAGCREIRAAEPGLAAPGRIAAAALGPRSRAAKCRAVRRPDFL